MEFGAVLPSPLALLIPLADPNRYTERRATNLYWTPVMRNILNGSSSVQWKYNLSSNSLLGVSFYVEEETESQKGLLISAKCHIY